MKYICYLRHINTFFFFPSNFAIEYTTDNRLSEIEEMFIGITLGMVNVFWLGLVFEVLRILIV